jgi:NADP-dependent 3-hydroxy acid dehydrogenase YdfG
MYLLTKQYPLKRAFITGAASGLGRSLCYELAQEGWHIGISDINDIELAVTASQIELLGGKQISYHLDVSKREEFKKICDSYLNALGGIDLLFNNAGVGDGGLFEEYSLDNWEWMIGINQMSVIYGCHYFIPIFKKQKSGHIINIASLAAITCAPTMGAYNVTKAAVVAVSETLHGELQNHGINVSCVQSAYFKTNIAKSMRGGENFQKATQFLLDRSHLESKDVAQEILYRAGNREFYIILPKFARKIWRLKRLAPSWFRKKVRDDFMLAVKKSLTRNAKQQADKG